MGTSGLVAHWLGGRTAEGRWIVGGIFKELATEAAAQGFALLPTADPARTYQPHGWFAGLVHGVPFDPFAMAAYLDRKLAGEAVVVLLNTQAIDVTSAGGRLTHVVIHNKAGIQAVAASVVIDATGDADLAVRAGCPTELGRNGDHLMAPATLMFHVDNVDQDALADYIGRHDEPRFRTLISQLRAAGEWPFPYEIFISVQLQEKGTMMINTSRLVGVDGSDGGSVSDALRRGREETQRLLAVMRRRFPGFAAARLKAVAPALGVRETRRIVGDFVLTVADVCAGRAFSDAIGFSSYGWDLPDPRQPSRQPMTEGRVAKPPFTPLPYRIMLPRGACNLLCPGRAVSVERDVLGPVRVMAPVMAMGEAAGAAAARAAATGCACAEVDVAALRAALREWGAVVDQEALHV